MNGSPAADLSQLKDISLPNAISDWPIAFGWWALLVITLLSLFASVYFWQYFKAKNANKKAALRLLKLKYHQFNADSDSVAFLQHSNQILKRYCLKQYPAAVSLSGLAWIDFLIHHSEETLFNKELAHAMSEGLYQEHCLYDGDKLYVACVSWLKNNKPALDKTKKHSKKHSTEHSIGHSIGHSHD
jgi:hypothetical protein